MSEKSFAVVAISAAIICGVFFYPEPPPPLPVQATPAVAAVVAAPPLPPDHAATHAVAPAWAAEEKPVRLLAHSK